MAIQKSFADQFGATHTAAYARVHNVSITERTASIAVQIYHNAAARSKADSAAEKPVIMDSTELLIESAFTTYFDDGVLDNNGVSPMKQAYAWLKTQTDFMGVNWTTGTTDV